MPYIYMYMYNHDIVSYLAKIKLKINKNTTFPGYDLNNIIGNTSFLLRRIFPENLLKINDSVAFVYFSVGKAV